MQESRLSVQLKGLPHIGCPPGLRFPHSQGFVQQAVKVMEQQQQQQQQQQQLGELLGPLHPPGLVNATMPRLRTGRGILALEPSASSTVDTTGSMRGGEFVDRQRALRAAQKWDRWGLSGGAYQGRGACVLHVHACAHMCLTV